MVAPVFDELKGKLSSVVEAHLRDRMAEVERRERLLEDRIRLLDEREAALGRRERQLDGPGFGKAQHGPGEVPTPARSGVAYTGQARVPLWNSGAHVANEPMRKSRATSVGGRMCPPAAEAKQNISSPEMAPRTPAGIHDDAVVEGATSKLAGMFGSQAGLKLTPPRPSIFNASARAPGPASQRASIACEPSEASPEAAPVASSWPETPSGSSWPEAPSVSSRSLFKELPAFPEEPAVATVFASRNGQPNSQRLSGHREPVVPRLDASPAGSRLFASARASTPGGVCEASSAAAEGEVSAMKLKEMFEQKALASKGDPVPKRRASSTHERRLFPDGPGQARTSFGRGPPEKRSIADLIRQDSHQVEA